MSSKHTPGPWVVKTAENQQGSFDIDCKFGYHIAETIGGLDGEEEANARLIAAAPELLAALEEVLAYCSEHGHDWMCMAQAHAAIAKATGEKHE